MRNFTICGLKRLIKIHIWRSAHDVLSVIFGNRCKLRKNKAMNQRALVWVRKVSTVLLLRFAQNAESLVEERRKERDGEERKKTRFALKMGFKKERSHSTFSISIAATLTWPREKSRQHSRACCQLSFLYVPSLASETWRSQVLRGHLVE